MLEMVANLFASVILIYDTTCQVIKMNAKLLLIIFILYLIIKILKNLLTKNNK